MVVPDWMARCELAEESGVPARVASAVAEVLRGAVDAGLGPRDWSDLVLHLEGLAKLKLELPPPRKA